jgi:hypothetical protein
MGYCSEEFVTHLEEYEPAPAFLSGRDVHFVDFDWSSQIKGRRIDRSGEVLDASVHGFVYHLNFAP